MLKDLARTGHATLSRPMQVLWICVGITIASILLDGTFIHLWRLHRQESSLISRIDESRVKLRQLEYQIQESQQPQFIERQARDQFDLVKEGDLIFVFAEEEAIEPVLQAKNTF